MDRTSSSNGSTIASTWNYIFNDLADPRTSGWFLMSNPIPLAIIVFSYLYFILKCGPNFMKNKRPYSLKTSMKIYNVFQIAFNVYLFREAVNMWASYNWNCQPVDYSYSPTALRHAWASYLYFINKITDLIDTIFFVLRKKDSHISFLHVFHHTMMPIFTWIFTKYIPGGHNTFVGLLNTFVHILLYSYYFLAALGPKVQKYLWWKKYITTIQLVQFGLVFVHGLQLFIFDCGYPIWAAWLTATNAIFFFYLFSDFYKKNYLTPKADENAEKARKNK